MTKLPKLPTKYYSAHRKKYHLTEARKVYMKKYQLNYRKNKKLKI